MINITDKRNCVGCRACEQICPKRCISISADSEGFNYPVVNIDICIDCHLCERVCPVLMNTESAVPLKAFGCKADNADLQLKSSSGGLFSLLAEHAIRNGGIVYGAAFDDDFRVIHRSIDNMTELDNLRRSKYVQSDTCDTFRSVKTVLDAGTLVLYCGTPCQIKGLRMFLRKPYTNLITVDFICHGTPSPKVWHDYLDGLKATISPDHVLSAVNFRSKSAGGWHKFALEFCFRDSVGRTKRLIEYPRDNPYYQLFFQNISLRPSCYKCPAKGFSSGSDLTLADFWGVKRVAPELDDDNGVSLVFINSANGKDIIDSLAVIRHEVSVRDATASNPSAYHAVSEPRRRGEFFNTSTFSMKHLKKYSGLDVYGRSRRWIIERLLKLMK